MKTYLCSRRVRRVSSPHSLYVVPKDGVGILTRSCGCGTGDGTVTVAQPFVIVVVTWQPSVSVGVVSVAYFIYITNNKCYKYQLVFKKNTKKKKLIYLVDYKLYIPKTLVSINKKNTKKKKKYSPWVQTTPDALFVPVFVVAAFNLFPCRVFRRLKPIYAIKYQLVVSKI